MTKTNENDDAAGRAEADPEPPSGWVSQPEVSDEHVLAATGKIWDEWRVALDAWGAADQDHPAIAQHLAEHHGLDGWWSQSVTGGYERITGRRLPHQMPDGTFTANTSRTIAGSASELRTLLDNESDRFELFGRASEPRSKPGVKAPRFSVGPGVAKISMTAKGGGRVTVGIQHEKLPTAEDVVEWTIFWSDWLDALGAD